MSTTTADRPVPSFAQPRAGWLPVTRLLLAVVITAGALPLGLGICLAMWTIDGRIEYRYLLGVLLPGTLATLLLSWGLSRREEFRPWTIVIGVLLLMVWGAATAVLATLRTNADPWMIAFYAAATLWMVWLAWLGFWPISWTARVVTLAVLLPPQFAFHQFAGITDLTGDAQLKLAWRASLADRDLPAIDGGPANVTPALTGRDTDFPQFLGRGRDAIVRDVRLEEDWETHPPKELWRQPIGEGWSAFAIVGGLAFTQEQRGSQECVVCYDVTSGQVLWAHRDDAKFESTMGGNGPRATPTVYDGRVYAVGGVGRFHCLDAATGAAYWTKELRDESAESLYHGACSSPLVVGDLVYVCPISSSDNSLAAYHRISGELAFEAGGGLASYSSPAYAEIAGVPQILTFKAQAIVGHNPATGEVLWSFPWGNKSDVNVAQPIVLGSNRIFISTDYGVGAALLDVVREDGQWRIENLWKELKKTMNNKFSSSILFEDRIVGLDNGILAAFDAKSGELLWKLGRYKHGQILRVDDWLLVLSEDGDLILVNPARDKKDVREIGRVNGALEGKTWNNLAFAPPYLLIRNSQWAVCYELARKGDKSDSAPHVEETARTDAENTPRTPPETSADPAPSAVEPTPDPLPPPPADVDPLPALPLP